MGAIAKGLHELWHDVDRQPMDVVFAVRFKGKDKVIRRVLVTHLTTYQFLAFYVERVVSEVEATVKDQRRPGEQLLATGVCTETLSLPAVELQLAAGHGFIGTGMPSFYNPVHFTFVKYSEHWIDGHLVLAHQSDGFYRYCVVPQHLVDRATPAGITVLAF